MTTLPKPTVGRVVHYTSQGHSLGTKAGTCRAAIITEVKDDNTVSVAVFTPRGTLFYEAISQDPGKAAGTWHWPEIEAGPTSSIFPAKMRNADGQGPSGNVRSA